MARRDVPLTSSEQPSEELAGVVAVSDAGEGTVLPRHADAGLQHHGDQECGLALREALAPERLDAPLEGQGSAA
ncbi:hypothetical protein [Luteitalea pratensis]|uniref:hypothetical protein n=1 Tax=Luteitalea pratensis TaxID=1855912 RepID=UPI000D73EDEC|nr:hypothetical protein [Luteitalea pratensis]